MTLLNSSKVVLFLISFLASVLNVQAEEEVDIWKKNSSSSLKEEKKKPRAKNSESIN